MKSCTQHHHHHTNRNCEVDRFILKIIMTHCILLQTNYTAYRTQKLTASFTSSTTRVVTQSIFIILHMTLPYNRYVNCAKSANSEIKNIPNKINVITISLYLLVNLI